MNDNLKGVLTPVIIKIIVSLLLAIFAGPQLAELICIQYEVPDGLPIIAAILVFFWSYFFLSCVVYSLNLGIGLALVIGIFAIAVSGALAMGNTFAFAHLLHYGKTPAQINFETDGLTQNEFWILVLVTVVAFLIFPIIDIIRIIVAARDGS